MLAGTAARFLRGRTKLLMSNRVRLERLAAGSGMTIVNGTPVMQESWETHWEGIGSLQYLRPRTQRSVPSVDAGLIEDPVTVIAYLPIGANPDEGMRVVDVDGVVGPAGQALKQSRQPSDVGGIGVYWEVYLGKPTNA